MQRLDPTNVRNGQRVDGSAARRGERPSSTGRYGAVRLDNDATAGPRFDGVEHAKDYRSDRREAVGRSFAPSSTGSSSSAVAGIGGISRQRSASSLTNRRSARIETILPVIPPSRAAHLNRTVSLTANRVSLALIRGCQCSTLDAPQETASARGLSAIEQEIAQLRSKAVRFGRWLTVHGKYDVYLVVSLPLWGRHGITPLWCKCWTLEDVARRLQARFDESQVEKGAGGRLDLCIPIRLAAGVERDRVVGDAVRQMRRVTDELKAALSG